MTIEEKAKAYDEAKARMSRAFNSNRCTLGFMNEIFPELKDSDSNRIRQKFIKLVKMSNEVGGFALHKWEADEMLAWLEKQSNSTDKVEPKFKVGDWIVQENIGIYKVVEVCESWYEVVNNKDKHYSIGFDKEDMCHLWTIKDAKDGDVLVDEDNDIGIYKEIEGICWHSYIYLGGDNCLYGFNICGSHKQNSTKPATKEQRDNLFKKINEEGYVWYPNSKELYKLIKINYD